MPKSKIKKTSKSYPKTQAVTDEFIAFLAIVAIFFLAVFILFFNNTKSASAPTVVVKETTVILKAENGSNETGTAIIKEVAGKVEVSLNLKGAPKAVIQPAHIHIGSCPGVGTVAFTLNSPVGGKSVTVLDTTYDQLMTGLPLALNVHKSTTATNVYVSCGQLAK